MRRILILIAAGVMIMFSCKSKKQSDIPTPIALDSLTRSLLVLEDSMQRAWEVLDKSETQKVFYLKRLLDEIKYTNVYDPLTHDSLMESVEKLNNMMLTRRSISDSETIDEYDYYTTRLISSIEKIASTHPKYEEYVLMDELITEINDAQDKLLFKRGHYDEFAKKSNELIKMHRETLPVEDTSFLYQKKGLFTIE